MYFDEKPVVIKAWSPDLELTKSKLNSVLVWVKLHGLDIKYWSAPSLRKNGSLLGKPLMAGSNTQSKVGINFVHILVEMEISRSLKDVIYFKNERGTLID